MDNRTPLHVAGAEAVRPLAGTDIERKMRRNAQWLLSLNPDRIVACIRIPCGVDTRGVQPYGGWPSYHYYYVRALCNPRAIGLVKPYIEGWSEPKEPWE